MMIKSFQQRSTEYGMRQILIIPEEEGMEKEYCTRMMG